MSLDYGHAIVGIVVVRKVHVVLGLVNGVVWKTFLVEVLIMEGIKDFSMFQEFTFVISDDDWKYERVDVVDDDGDSFMIWENSLVYCTMAELFCRDVMCSELAEVWRDCLFNVGDKKVRVVCLLMT